MSYFDGFVVPVPRDKKDAYRAAAASFAPILHEFGAIRHVEAWEDDVPDGKRTDFRRAVQAEPGEAVVFSWIEYPDRAARDAANAKIMSDARMENLGELPFDARRMIYGGFAVAAGDPPAKGGYVDGALAAVPAGNRSAYLAMQAGMSDVIREHGALRIVEGWGDDVPDGTLTDFKGAVAAQDGEVVTFSWIEWPDKATRDAGWRAMMADPRTTMRPAGVEPPFDAARMVHGGFMPILDI